MLINNVMVSEHTNIEDFLDEHLEDRDPVFVDIELSDETCLDKLFFPLRRFDTFEANIVFSSYSEVSKSRINVEPLLTGTSSLLSFSVSFATVFTTAAFFLNFSNIPVSPP